jgi:hypothetical protein
VATFASPSLQSNLSAIVNFGSGTTTAAVTLLPNVLETIPGVGNVQEYRVDYTGNWTPTEQSLGASIIVTITDSSTVPSVASQVLGTIAVSDAPLTLSTTPTVTATEGTAISPTIATFTDAPGSAATDFTGTIDWGDGTAPSAATFSGAAGGPFTMAGSHTYLDPGTSPIKLTINDGGTVYTFTSNTVSGANFIDPALTVTKAPNIAAVVNAPLTNVQVATVTDPNTAEIGSGLSASIAWTDTVISPLKGAV